ncbi:MAG TPA: efflux RND transporter permease subunit [Candidatus Xenobia bacterium]|jgi:multidrug efflux pump subunit AcrB
MMWLVRLALRQPYTIVVMCLMIFTLGVLTLIITPKDIFPEIDIPVVSVLWQFHGITPDDMEKRIVTISERAVTTTVNDVEHIESQSLYGVGVIKIFFHPGAKIAACVAQVTAIMQTLIKTMPPGSTPPLIIQYSASSVPILQMGITSKTLNEQQLFDYTLNFVRVYLYRAQGAQLPGPYGGKARAVMVDMDPDAMQAHGITAQDISAALGDQNLILPAGTAKMGSVEYDVQLNASTDTVEALNNLPLKAANGAVVHIGDVAQVRDGSQVQSNIVTMDLHRAALLSILKAGGSSTLDVVSNIKEMMAPMEATLPKALHLELLFDQSIFVKASIFSVVREGVIAAALTGLMILLFLGSWRSTLVVTTSIPLAILSSIIILGALGVTLNVMTLGGLALAVGILVDDATVEVENIHRNHAMGKPLRQAILDGAAQIATPTFVSTLSICIVFVSVEFLTGPARFMFTPMALAVVFAMLASYLLSRTLVPTMVNTLLAHETHGGENAVTRAVWNMHGKFDHAFESMRKRYEGLLGWVLGHPRPVFAIFGVFLAGSAMLLPFVGEDFFPSVDAGEFRLHVRCPNGTRLENTEHLFHQVELALRQLIPTDEIKTIIDNIGLPNSGINLVFTDTATIGPNEGEILVALTEDHHPTPQYVRRLRRELPKRFPQMTFFFQPADMVNQILNFGLPAPIDVQVQGRDPKNVAIARQIEAAMHQVPGAADVHLHQILDAPAFHIDVDRERAALLGVTQNQVASNILLALSGSGQVAPNFWLNPQNHISYNVTLQAPERTIDSVPALMSQPMVDTGTNVSNEELGNLATIRRTTSPAVICHYNVQPVLDLFANVQGRDLGGVSGDVGRILDRIVNPDHPKALDWSVPQTGPGLPRGTVLVMRGQTLSMTQSFTRLGYGLLFAILLVYMLMVVNFQSWVDPLIIISALPGALAGIVWVLFVTQTTFNVPSLMGAIMCIGVAVANSILVVTFANDCRREGDDARTAALRAGETRLRPVLMTAAAMIIGMLPMALGIGEGAEQNAPLGRAVIGGLLVATVTTLFIVPLVYRLWRVQGPPPVEVEAE